MTPGPPAQVVIGLDVGTTGVKAAAFGLGSSWRSVAIREYPLLAPAPGQKVQDPTRILTASGDALAECVATAGSAEVLAVSVSAGMHGLMALDDELSPLTQLITWADARAREEARSLRRSGRAAQLHALTGVPVHPMTPLTKLMWFARHDPQTWTAARWWVGLKDYILLWLTGTLVTELSSASGTGLLDMSTRTWSTAAIELCGVDADRLPPILSTTATLGLAAAAARKVGLRAGTPVVVGAADGPLGNLGSGAVSPGIAGLSLGTSGAVRMAVNEPRVDAGRTLFCYALTDTAWVVGGAISNGGVVLRWIGQSLAPDVQPAAGHQRADAALLKLAASVPAGSDGLVMLPYLLAERAPLWDPDLPGAYLGLRLEHTRAHLIRAAVEGVCLQVRIILDRLDDVESVSSVRVTGGVFRSALWREVMAAMLARPIHVVGAAEGTALGAAALGLFALDRAPTPTDAVTELSEAGAAPPESVEPDRQLVETYDQLRASVPELIGALGDVAGLFARIPDAEVGMRSP
ncbi:MAG: gluconokinase [Pseudonocardiales bacterium]